MLYTLLLNLPLCPFGSLSKQGILPKTRSGSGLGFIGSRGRINIRTLNRFRKLLIPQLPGSLRKTTGDATTTTTTTRENIPTEEMLGELGHIQWNTYACREPIACLEGPSTQIVGLQGPKAIQSTDFGNYTLTIWVLGPSAFRRDIGPPTTSTCALPLASKMSGHQRRTREARKDLARRFSSRVHMQPTYRLTNEVP